MSRYRALFVALLLAFVTAAVYTQTKPGQPPAPPAAPHGGMGQGQEDSPEQKQMMEQHQKMLDMHRQMQEQAEAMEKQLKEKIDAMNAAKGDKRVDAVVDVVNTMYQQRIQAQENMKKLQESLSTMRGPGGMGGMGGGMGGMGGGMGGHPPMGAPKGHP